MDRAWWNEYAAELQRLESCELWTTNREAARVYRLNYVRGEVGAGMPVLKTCSVKLGGNSGFQSVQLAILFGAARVVLLGFDLANDGKRSHWHGNHARLGNPVEHRFAEWRQQFHRLNREKPAELEIVNATRRSKLACFPLVPLAQALA